MIKRCSEDKKISTWNEWRKNVHEMIYLQGADLRGAYLSGANLKYAYLEGVDLSYAHLEGSNFENARLNNADLTETHMEKDSNGGPTKFNERTIFKGTSLINTYMQGAKMLEADFTDAELSGTHFEEADLFSAHFEKAPIHIEDVHFEGTKLYRADFTGTSFDNVHFEKSSNGKSTNLTRAIFKNTNMFNTNFKDADMSYMNLTDATLRQVLLEGANLHYSILEDASISDANLKGADFTGATVNNKTTIQACDIDEKTDFTSVDLDSIRIDPPLLFDLKTNIRKIAWSRYYKEIGKTFTGKIKIGITKLFWWFSDYGSSIHRILWAIPITALGFTSVYIFIAAFEPNTFTNIDLISKMPQFKVPLWRQLLSVSYFAITTTFPLWLFVIFKFFCFSLVTMITLGFGGINVATVYDNLSISAVALCLVTLNIIFGYIYLSLLVIQLGNFLQSLPSRMNRIKSQGKTKLPE